MPGFLEQDERGGELLDGLRHHRRSKLLFQGVARDLRGQQFAHALHAAVGVASIDEDKCGTVRMADADEAKCGDTEEMVEHGIVGGRYRASQMRCGYWPTDAAIEQCACDGKQVERVRPLHGSASHSGSIS